MTKMMEEVFVPGRLCILGEHTDWAAEYISQNPSLCKGHTIVCATNQGLHARIHSYNPNSFRFDSKNEEGAVQSFESPLQLSVLQEVASEGGFFSYIAGTVATLLSSDIFKSHANGSEVKGIYIDNYLTTLPMQKGLSSSAAICVLIVIAFNRWFQLGLTQAQIMEFAYQGEMMTPSHCGRMDQCVVMGGNAMALMEFENTSCSLTPITCAKSIYFIVADLRAHKDTVKILKDLNSCFPFPKGEIQILMHEYVHGIEGIAKRAKEAIESGDVTSLAQSMTDAQTLFDRCAMPNCLSELTAPKLHTIMNDPWLRQESLAVKGVGSQGDGSAQILVTSSEQQEKVLRYLVEEYNVHAFLLTISGKNDVRS